jgi:MFS transporter, DHA2 family, glioxin efflux transporter
MTGIFNPFMIAGPIIAAIGGGLLTTLAEDSSAGKWIGYQILVGIGVGACLTIPLMLAGVVVKPQEVSNSTAIIIFSQSMGGAIMLAAAQGIFQNELVRILRQKVPDIDPLYILSMGASSDATSSIPAQELGRILGSYVEALQHTFVLTIPVAGIAFLVAFLQPWFRYHQVKEGKPAAENEEGEEGEKTRPTDEKLDS